MTNENNKKKTEWHCDSAYTIPYHTIQLIHFCLFVQFIRHFELPKWTSSIRPHLLLQLTAYTLAFLKCVNVLVHFSSTFNLAALFIYNPNLFVQSLLTMFYLSCRNKILTKLNSNVILKGTERKTNAKRSGKKEAENFVSLSLLDKS